MYDLQSQSVPLSQRRYLAAKGVLAMDGPMALDAQAQTTTTVNSGIPAFLSTFVDRDRLRIIFAPMKAASILGEERKTGDWVTKTAMFLTEEYTGDVTSYGDYSENGSAGANWTFPQRQSYHYQTIMQIGEREVDSVALAGLNAVEGKKNGAVLGLNKFQNRSYLFGISGLQCYGILNDPALTAAIQPGPKVYGSQAHGPWTTGGVVTATPNEVLVDVQSLYIRLVNQAFGNIELDNEVPLKLVCDAASQVALTAANSFGVTAIGLIKTAFPNMTFETAPEYATAAGNVVQLICGSLDGQGVGFVAFTEKLRAHPVIRAVSSWKQKLSQGTWGAVIRQPFLIAQMLGV